MAHPIPDAALAQHIAILGKTGSGKTYAAKGVVENILKQGGRVCVIDPTGAWHGLRSSATGKSAGFPVVIFGGAIVKCETIWADLFKSDVFRGKNYPDYITENAGKRVGV